MFQEAPSEECGVFAIYGNSDAAAHCALGLHALQHRGQEAAGIISHNDTGFSAHRELGLVGDNFNSSDVINKLSGNCAIGHVRYSTAGGMDYRNIQPLFAEYSFGGLALAHNGNLTNAETLRRELISKGAIFQTTMDSEVINHLIARSEQASVAERVIDALQQVVGAWSLVAMDESSIYAVRDPNGVRPLILGKLGDDFVIASESCAFDIIGAKTIRDIAPGEMVIINQDGFSSTFPFAPQPRKFCVFEYIYFARPDSVMEGKNVYEARIAIGKELAKDNQIDADLVVPVPDSGVPAAIGYARQADMDFHLGIIRNHYVGRTFIEPSDHVRHLGVKLKHNANSPIIQGKKVILVDDSIVRGTTSKKIVAMVREAGASEVHMRIASPPTTNPCFYGVDTPERSKLMAANHSVEEMCKIIGADSLAFLSIEAMYRAISKIDDSDNEQQPANGRDNGASASSNIEQIRASYCDACFSGNYPIELVDRENEEQV